MMPNRNYQKELEQLIGQFGRDGRVPRLLLHSCCAPCSSYVLEYLSEYFNITLFYYNPNITEREEYTKRVEEVKRLIAELPVRHPVTFLEGEYEPQVFTGAVRGLEHEPEGGARCGVCFRLRLDKAAQAAARIASECGEEVLFTTTLTISPLKNAGLLNEIGEETASRYKGVSWLGSDFKKRGGYQRSIQLSTQYGLYRQDYCGCIYSKRERRNQL